MAITPGRKKLQRETNFHNIGVQGRKTGITLQQNARDENGIETLDGMFSSPEKSPPKRALRNGNTTATSSSMKLQESSAPEPTEVLSTRRVLKSTNTFLPPPAARSPLKTNIGSSPRRQSVAPLSRSPERQTSVRPVRASTAQPSVNRRLDFSADTVRPSVELHLRESIGRRNTKGSSDIFASKPELPPSPVKTRGLHTPEHEPETQDSIALVDNGVPDWAPGSEDEELLAAQLEVSNEGAGPREEKDVENLVPASAKSTRGPGRPRVRPQKQVDPTAVKRGRGRPSRASMLSESELVAPTAVVQKSRKQDSEVVDDDSVLPVLDHSIAGPLAKSGRGNRSHKRIAVHEDAAAEEKQQEENESPEPPPKKQKKAPKERDPNELMPAPSRPTNKKSSNQSRARSVSKAPLSPTKRPETHRSLTILRAETPAADSVHRTRSGRTVIQPLQHWMGEKAERDYDGSLLEVIRASVAPPSSRRASRAGSTAPRRGRKPGGGRRAGGGYQHGLGGIQEEDEDENGDLAPEEWELEKQILRIPCKGWDNVGQVVIDEEEEQDIAISSGAYEPRTVANGEFQYTKITSLSFFGSGLVDLPPGGQKREKYVRKMQMMFFVHRGKVEVMVNRMAFVISKGGFFHVPRGNTYSIRNETDYPAQLLFAQGCETEVLND